MEQQQEAVIAVSAHDDSTAAAVAARNKSSSSSTSCSSPTSSRSTRTASTTTLVGGPPFEAIRQTFQRLQQHKKQQNNRRQDNGMMDEDSSLEGGYNGSASENETSFSSSSSSPGAASSEYDTTSEDSGSDDQQQQQQLYPSQTTVSGAVTAAPPPATAGHPTTTSNSSSRLSSSRGGGPAARRPLLRVKRVRFDYTDDLADYSDSMILNSSCSEANIAADAKQQDDDDDIMSSTSTACSSEDDVASSHHRKPLQVNEEMEMTNGSTTNNKLFSVDGAVMAHILTYLDPPAILDTLTMPLNKKWVTNYTRSPELWRVLCLLEPFKAEVDDDDEDQDDEDSEDDNDSFKDIDMGGKDCLTSESYTKYRLTYTSFVKCARYLTRITDDSRNGRPLTVMGFGNNNDRAGGQLIAANRNLQRFFSKAREVTAASQRETMISEDDDALVATTHAALAFSSTPKHRSSANKRHCHGIEETTALTKKPKHTGPSKLTSNLLGPSLSSTVATASGGGLPVAGGDVELPWSCAIFSIVNWMVGFSDVEGILVMCLKALPLLLEDEQQRIAAQGSGLTDIILRSMVSFPNSAVLHTAAFHTIVLLARPIGGREGMLFHSSMVNTNGIFNSAEVGSASGKSGIAVLLDSMRRFCHDEALQAMGCWSLVNIALAPSQQDILIKLGAVDVALAAMVQHKDSADVQFRALFALINLIIPPSSIGPRDDPNADVAAAAQQQPPPPPPLDNEASAGSDSDGSVDVDQIVELVVGCMKHYSTNESILNRACLVLHNLSLNPAFHSVMLWTPHCYLMLDWCLKHHPNDRVLQQGALNTIQRLQTTLSRNAALRKKLRASLKSQRAQFREQVEHRGASLSSSGGGTATTIIVASPIAVAP
jgi:hypothetical protein